MYNKLNRFRAFESLTNAIKTANVLNDPNLFTNNVSLKISSKKFSIATSYNVPGFDISKTFDELSKTDFQSSLIYAESFTDKHLRTLAVLGAVKDC